MPVVVSRQERSSHGKSSMQGDFDQPRQGPLEGNRLGDLRSLLHRHDHPGRQERAVLTKDERLPTFVYVDEASDYFDRNIGIILSQVRKNRIGMVLSHQYLGQLEPKLQEAVSANTAIKFAGGVSAKDARAFAGDLRTDTSMIENQPRMSPEAREQVREAMREKYAVHHTEIGPQEEPVAGKHLRRGMTNPTLASRCDGIVVSIQNASWPRPGAAQEGRRLRRSDLHINVDGG